MKLRTLLIPLVVLFTAPVGLHAEEAAAAAKPAAVATARINVNTADALALTGLKGVGEKKAQAIIAYRKSKGPFSSLEQFEAVPGIGPSIVAKNKSAIVFR